MKFGRLTFFLFIFVGLLQFPNQEPYALARANRTRSSISGIQHEEHILYYVGPVGKLTSFEYNGARVRNESFVDAGISGSDSAAILTMEALAKSPIFSKTSRFYLQASQAMEGTQFKGVTYLKSLTSNISKDITTVIAPDYLAFAEDFFEQFTLLRRFVLVGHTYKIEPTYSVLRALRERGIALHFVHLNEWSKNYTLANTDSETFSLFFSHHIIHNPVFWDVLKTQFDSIERSDWIFHAAYERGGLLSRQVFCKLSLPASFRVLDYHFGKSYVADGCLGVENVGSLSKPALYSMLSRSKYFVYLLVLPDSGQVHKDMFPTCVLEAIFLGVRVVTLPVGPLVLLFTGLVDFVPIEDSALAARFLDYNFNSFEPMLLSSSFVDYVANFVLGLDSQDFTSERMRRIERAREIYNENMFSNSWANLFK